MTDDLKAEILHLVAHERGSTTKELFAAINVLRLPGNNLWPHKEPEDQPALQLMLLSLSAQGHVVNAAGVGWCLSSAVPKSERRTFEEVTQGSFL